MMLYDTHFFRKYFCLKDCKKKKDIQKHLHLKMALSNKAVYFPIFIESSNRCWLK